MAAFAAAVNIDAFAYLPVQDFGNAFSTFVAQNTGAQKTERIRRGSAPPSGRPSALPVSPRWCASSAAPSWACLWSPARRTIAVGGVPAH